MKRVLVVEDEYAIRDLITLNLTIAGYNVTDVDNAEAALKVYSEQPGSFDIALLDIMLPGMSGLELCNILRRDNKSLGIIILSARTQEKDKIEGLSIGADDYMIKPFSVGEMVARVDAIYRRTRNSDELKDEQTLLSGDFTLDRRSRMVMKNGEQLDLTQVEYQLMELFIENIGVALDRESILRAVWGKEFVGDIKIVDVNICRLRMKVEDEPSAPQHIITVWGYGYRWQ